MTLIFAAHSKPSAAQATVSAALSTLVAVLVSGPQAVVAFHVTYSPSSQRQPLERRPPSSAPSTLYCFDRAALYKSSVIIPIIHFVPPACPTILRTYCYLPTTCRITSHSPAHCSVVTTVNPCSNIWTFELRNKKIHMEWSSVSSMQLP